MFEWHKYIKDLRKEGQGGQVWLAFHPHVKVEITTDPADAPETDEEYWERHPWVKHWEEEMG